MSTDVLGNVYTTGTFFSNAIYTSSSYTLQSNGASDIYISKHDSNGNLVWVRSFGSVLDDYPTSLKANNNNNVFSTGYFRALTDFDPDAGITPLQTPGGNYDMYIHKMGLCVTPAAPANTTPAANQFICDNKSTILRVNGYGAITWYASATFTTAISTNSICTTATLSAGTYTFYASVNTCTNSPAMTAVTVTVNPLPTVLVSTSNTLLCTGQTASLTANGATSYTWNTTATSAIIAVSPTVATTYTINGTDINGCKNTATILQDVSTCTGLLSYTNNLSFDIYPNPFSSIVNIQSSNTIKSILITDVLGREKIKLMDANMQQLNLSELNNGIYFITVILENNSSISKKIIKI